MRGLARRGPGGADHGRATDAADELGGGRRGGRLRTRHGCADELAGGRRGADHGRATDARMGLAGTGGAGHGYATDARMG